ncbi:MAG TPA: Fur family transcriptional regulator, partial [Pseudomonas sp.]|nr:Fur family transcriptional regulator [Pseudomonas sp.]
PAVHQAILDGAKAVGFQVEGQTVEVVGQCAACRKRA